MGKDKGKEKAQYSGGKEATVKPDEASEATVKPDYVVSMDGGYRTSLGAVRDDLQNRREGTLIIALIGRQLPSETSVCVQLRCSDAYFIGFLGKEKTKYRFADQCDGWGVSCGVNGSYQNLPDVASVNLSNMDELNQLPKFLKGGDGGGDPFKRAVVIAAAVISESLRFKPLQDDFARLFAGSGRPVALERATLFQYWETLSAQKDPRVLLYQNR